MKQKITVFFVFFLFSIFGPLPIFAEEGDYVKKVHECGQNIIIEMQHSGYITYIQSFIDDDGNEYLNEGNYDSFQKIRNTAIELLNNEEKTGYFDPGSPIDICGFENARIITVLEKNEYKN